MRYEHVVVVGASLAGLFAAAASAGSGRTVTVIERDELPHTAEPRPGVPQGHQPHVLLYRGLLALEELLPGIQEELRAAGGVALDVGDLAWLADSGWNPYGVRQFPFVSATRPLLEHLVLDRVRQLPGVQVLDRRRVTSIGRDHDRWSVTTTNEVIDADLVIDASGRGSRLPAWLAEYGVGPVAVSEVDARVGYASRLYAIPPGVVQVGGVVIAATPQTLMGGLALPVERDRWIVAVVGSGDRRPPRDAAGYEAFLRELRDPILAELVAYGKPLGEVHVHRQTANRRHHYERLDDWPPGLLVVGDAFCAFDPVYGQGVAVAACEAVLLRRALDSGMRPGNERALLREFSGVVALPWAIASAEDLRLPTSTGTQTVVQRILGAWTRELGRLATHGHERAHSSLVRVYNLMASPRVLYHAALRARIRGYGPRVPRPTVIANDGPDRDEMTCR